MRMALYLCLSSPKYVAQSYHEKKISRQIPAEESSAKCSTSTVLPTTFKVMESKESLRRRHDPKEPMETWQLHVLWCPEGCPEGQCCLKISSQILTLFLGKFAQTPSHVFLRNWSFQLTRSTLILLPFIDLLSSPPPRTSSLTPMGLHPKRRALRNAERVTIRTATACSVLADCPFPAWHE